MKVTSLGLRTDLMLLRFDGEIFDRGDYYVVRTPVSQKFYYGNFLLFPDPPRKEDFKDWVNLFKQEFSDLSEIKHLTFCWDKTHGEEGHFEPFLKAGYELIENIVLSTSKVQKNPRYNSSAKIQKITTESEWEQVIQSQIACREKKYDEKSYEAFTRDQFRRFRRMVGKGLGSWFGAVVDDKVVANLGVFVDNGLGRFQNVTTNENYRQQGLCGTLVYEASRYALEELNAKNLVMVADPNYHAAKIYESVGFKPTEKLSSLLWFARTL